MVDERNKKNSAGDDDLLRNLNLENVEGLEGIQVESGRPLPKKVELDIDDLLLEEDEVEAPPTAAEKQAAEAPAAEEAAGEEDKEEAPAPRISWFKLAIVASGVLVPLMVLVVVGVIYFRTPAPPVPPPKPAEVGQANLELLPFVINFPLDKGEMLIEMEMALYFDNPGGQREFESQNLYWRDLIYRYVQGKNPAELKEPVTRDSLSRELVELINAGLKTGQVLRVQLKKLGVV